MQTRRPHHLRGIANENHRDPTNDEELWVVDVGAGQLRLIRGGEALKELIANHGLTETARVYRLSATSKALGEIAEVQSMFEGGSDAHPTSSEPVAEAVPVEVLVAVAKPADEPARVEAPVTVAKPAAEEPRVEAPVTVAKPAAEEPRAEPPVTIAKVAAEDAGDKRPTRVSDEFSLLDRPFDDGDYFEDPPRARWLRGAGLAVLLVVLGGAGYQLLHSRSGTRPPANAPEPVSAPVAVAAPPTAEPPVAAVIPPGPPAAAAPVAPAAAVPSAPDTPAVPAAAAAPAPVAPAAPAAAAAPEPVAPAAPASIAPAAPPPAAVERTQAPSRSYSELVAEGKRLFDGGSSRKAQALYEQALAETPDGTAALIGLAYVHLDRGKLQQAIGFFQRALDQDHGNASAVFGLAESYRQKGNRRAALAEFKRFLTLESTGDEADMARRLVQELENDGA
jgi:hypothetical protein